MKLNGKQEIHLRSLFDEIIYPRESFQETNFGYWTRKGTCVPANTQERGTFLPQDISV